MPMSPEVVIIASAFAGGVGVGTVGLVRSVVALVVVRRRLNAWKRTGVAADLEPLPLTPQCEHRRGKAQCQLPAGHRWDEHLFPPCPEPGCLEELGHEPRLGGHR
jgi:hypothetical protein